MTRSCDTDQPGKQWIKTAMHTLVNIQQDPGAVQQIGQVMLALPHAISLMGLRAACVIIPCYTLFSMWTMHLLNALYVEYKARKVCSQRALLSCVCCSGKRWRR